VITPIDIKKLISDWKSSQRRKHPHYQSICIYRLFARIPRQGTTGCQGRFLSNVGTKYWCV